MNHPLYILVRGLVDGGQPQNIYGREYMGYDPDVILIRAVQFEQPQALYRLAVTEEAARPDFEWLAEVTITESETGTLRHYLVRSQDVVETYGRKVLEVTPEQAAELQSELQRLTN
jgi:hypothetical protein